MYSAFAAQVYRQHIESCMADVANVNAGNDEDPSAHAKSHKVAETDERQRSSCWGFWRNM